MHQPHQAPQLPRKMRWPDKNAASSPCGSIVSQIQVNNNETAHHPIAVILAQWRILMLSKINPTKCTNPIKLLNHHEPPTTPEQALARQEAEPGAGLERRRLVVVLMLFTSFILFFNGVHGLAKSSALLPFL